MLLALIVFPNTVFAGPRDDSSAGTITSLRTPLVLSNLDFWNLNQRVSRVLLGYNLNHRWPRGFNIELGINLVSAGDAIFFPQGDYIPTRFGAATDVRIQPGYSLVLHGDMNSRIQGLVGVSGGYRRANFSGYPSSSGYAAPNVAHMVEGGVGYEIHFGRKCHRVTLRLSAHANRAFYSYIFPAAWDTQSNLSPYRYGVRLNSDIGFSVKNILPFKQMGC